MQENTKLSFLSNFFKEYLDPKINRLINRNSDQEKDLKLVSVEFEKLNKLLKESEKIAEMKLKKSQETSEMLKESLKSVVNISQISSGQVDDKIKKPQDETKRRILTRNQTETNVFLLNKEKKDARDVITPFNRKKIINLEDTKGNDEKTIPKTPKAKGSLLETIRNGKEEKQDQGKNTSTAKPLTRNKTTANFSSRKSHPEEEKVDKTVNQSMTKAKKNDTLQVIPETKSLARHPTTARVETARKDKHELNKHLTEALIKPNTKVGLNREKELKNKDQAGNYGSNINSTKKIITKSNGKLEKVDIKTDEYNTTKETKKDTINLEGELKKSEDKINMNTEEEKVVIIDQIDAHILKEESAKVPEIQEKKQECEVKFIQPEKNPIKYFAKILNDSIWTDNIFKFLDLKSDDRHIFKINKKFKKFFNNEMMLRIEKELAAIQGKITNLKEKYKEEEITKEAPKFVMTRGAIKAVELLNDKMYMNIFKSDIVPQKEVLNIYKILLLYINKRETALIKNNNQFWKEVCNLFLAESEGKIGDFINKYCNNLNFSTENLFIISKIIGNDLTKMTAPNYTKICPTTGLVFFFIKDALEYSGIIVDKKTPIIKLMNLLDYNYESLSSMNDRLKAIKEKN